MRVLRSWLRPLGTLALAGLPIPADAQRVGEEFQVNTYTTGPQVVGHDFAIASDAAGNFVVVWASAGQDGSSFGIFGQRYDAAGAALGAEFQVNSHTTGFQYHPCVASDSSGNFVVAWTSSGGQDGSGYGIFGQRYDSGGAPRGAEFGVNSYTLNDQRYPSVASDANGNFVVIWDSYRADQDGDGTGVFGQRYDAAGMALGEEFQVNSYTTGDQLLASVASDANGNFVVAWQSSGQDGDDYGIFGQRYDDKGVPQGLEFRVNSSTPGLQRFPSAASGRDGNFVVVWATHGVGGPARIDGQRYDSRGVAQGDEFRVNTFPRISPSFPSVATDTRGNFVVVWEGNRGPGSEVFGRHYDESGVAHGEAFRLTNRRRAEERPSLRATGINQFVVVRESGDDHDGSSSGVFGLRLAFGDAVRDSP